MTVQLRVEQGFTLLFIMYYVPSEIIIKPLLK